MDDEQVYEVIKTIRYRLESVVTKPEGYFIHMNIRKALEALDELEALIHVKTQDSKEEERYES